MVLRPLYKETSVSRRLQFKVLLPACPCWRQPAHSDQGEDAGVLFNSVIYTISVPYNMNDELGK